MSRIIIVNAITSIHVGSFHVKVIVLCYVIINHQKDIYSSIKMS